MFRKLAELVEKIEENPDWFFFGVTMGIFSCVIVLLIVASVVSAHR